MTGALFLIFWHYQDPKCLNTEEEIDESSGDSPVNYECVGSECSVESFSDCDDNETNCTKTESTNHMKRSEVGSQHPILDSNITSGN